MKKLLSLLSVLTISGTAVPTTIAASPYQKEEKLNSDINYSETNNLEILNRVKRSRAAQRARLGLRTSEESTRINKKYFSSCEDKVIQKNNRDGLIYGSIGGLTSGPRGIIGGAVLGALGGIIVSSAEMKNIKAQCDKERAKERQRKKYQQRVREQEIRDWNLKKSRGYQEYMKQEHQKWCLSERKKVLNNWEGKWRYEPKSPKRKQQWEKTKKRVWELEYINHCN